MKQLNTLKRYYVNVKFEKYGKKFECNDKIFIDRRESPFNHCQIINDEEIKTHLKKKGFTVNNSIE